MSVSEQLPYVKKYLVNLKKGKEFESFLDLYLGILYPYARKETHDFALGSEISAKQASIVRNANKNIDLKHGNGDGLLTKNEIANWVS